MVQERISSKPSPAEDPIANIRRGGILRGRAMADDILTEIGGLTIALSALKDLDPQVIKNYNIMVTMPASIDSGIWGDALESFFNPLSSIDPLNKNAMPELVLRHARYITLIEQGLIPKQTPDKSRFRFNIPWETHTPEDIFLYLYYEIPGKPLFLTLTPREVSKGGIRVAENLILARNKKDFHNFWVATIGNNAPNESKNTALALR